MAFKMKGSPMKLGTIQGTAGHSSALKMKMEKDAAAKMKKEAAMKMKMEAAAKMKKKSPMEKELVGKQNNLPEELKAKIEAAPGKMKSPAKQVTLSDGSSGPFSEETIKKDKKKTTDTSKSEENIKKSTTKKTTKKKDPYAEALKKDPKLGSYVKERKKHKAGSAEYEALQAKINKAYGKTRSSKLKSAQIAANNKKATVSTADVKSGSTADKKTKPTKLDRMNKKNNEQEENRKVQDAKRTSKYAREYFGKGSAEEATAKYEAAVAKGEDLSGAGGGKRAVFFGNLRRNWNQAKQDKLKGKADRLAAEKEAAENKAIAEYNKNKK